MIPVVDIVRLEAREVLHELRILDQFGRSIWTTKLVRVALCREQKSA